MIYRCCDLQRRNLVAAHPTLNGIDYLEVIDRELPELDPLRQRTLLVQCLKPVPATFTAANVRVDGGERVRNVDAQWAAPAVPLPAQLGVPAEANTAAIVNALADAANVLVVFFNDTATTEIYTLSRSPLRRRRAAAGLRSAARCDRFCFRSIARRTLFKAAALVSTVRDRTADIDYQAKDYRASDA
jgi:hypothetical protein